MTFLYTMLDRIAKYQGMKKLTPILQLIVILAVLLSGIYVLFRTYNEIGLVAVMLVYFILMPRDSFLERKEMKKVEKSLNAASMENL